MLKDGKNIEEISVIMNVGIPEINVALINIDSAIGNVKSSSKIKKILVCLNERGCNFIGRLLFRIFNKTVFYTALIVSSISCIIFYWLFADMSFIYANVGIIEYIIILLLIMFVHEIGHVSVAYKFGIRDLKIDFGVFFIWPVFFVKLNKQVLLSRNNRIIVSAGGLYFQLLLSLVCMGLYLISGWDILLLVNNLNLAMVALNVFPFLILDGYWIYADLCKIENLNAKAKALSKTLLSGLSQFRQAPLALSSYTLLMLCTIVLLTGWMVYYLVSRAKYIPGMFYLFQENISLGIIFRGLWLFLPYLLLLIYLIKVAYGKLFRNNGSNHK